MSSHHNNNNNTTQLLVLHLLILTAVAAAQIALPGCQHRCGTVDLPYPFGLTYDCSLASKFRLTCNTTTTGDHFLAMGNLRVSHISSGNLTITAPPVVAVCYDGKGNSLTSVVNETMLQLPWPTAAGSPNRFTVIGCDSYAYLIATRNGRPFSMGCMSTCRAATDVPDGTCSGIGCCQVDVPAGLRNISIAAKSMNSHVNTSSFNNCTYTFIADKDTFRFSRDNLSATEPSSLSLVVDWLVSSDDCRNGMFCPCGRANTVRVPAGVNGTGYLCTCGGGYRGNPYLPDGCQTDIDECENWWLNNCTKHQSCVNIAGSYYCKHVPTQQFPLNISIGVAIGLVALLLIGSWASLVLKQRKLNLLRNKFFSQNGGLVLQQKLSHNHNSSSVPKIFTDRELKSATLDYHHTRVIGTGGFGTVYKGILPDDTVVAIKKSKLVDQDQTEQFVNEVVVLSQVNHRNVVKLVGCCLETQVPSLVYKFVPNGTLSDHIHNKDRSSKLTWPIRLRIATEAANALSYLHSSASVPIIHRDVKPSNILLENDYTAKVSDFGASRLIPIEQTELATMVQGTLGYLDPEYLHTNQLTEKSDVYSFGVVLVELLTGMTAVSFDRPEEERSLAMYFLSCLRLDRLFEIVERDILENEEDDSVEVMREQVVEVAKMAKMCLNMSGEERPTMREVSMGLEALKRVVEHPWSGSDYAANNNKNQELVTCEETQSFLANDSNYHNHQFAYDSFGNADPVIQDFSGR